MSAILSADDLNDFISPGVACIKPVETLPKQAPPEHDAYEVVKEGQAPQEHKPAEISLTDCLACSGCVTSAEAVLISLQSHAEVLNALDGPNDRLYVASVSPQVRASIAATYKVSERKAGWMIDQLLGGSQGLATGGACGNYFKWIVDTNAMREASLVLGAEETVEYLSRSSNVSSDESTSTEKPQRPILSSACPGWICYAEKTHPHVLPHLSRLKSPQALTGTILKTVLSQRLNIHPNQIWHVAIMPCFDKKLEASREELTDAYWRPFSSSSDAQSPVRDVDCVITARELLMLADTRGISFPNLPQHPIQDPIPFPDPLLHSFLFPPYHNRLSNRRHKQPRDAGTSGGYLHHILSTQLALHPDSHLTTIRGRNADVIEYTISSAPASGADPIFKAARYYGFRNIQNLVRKLKPPKLSRMPGGGGGVRGSRRPFATTRGGGTSTNRGGTGTDYEYVEVMACPGGCTNGGGQIKAADLPSSQVVVNALSGGEEGMEQGQGQKEWLRKVDEAYFSMSSDSDSDHENNENGTENKRYFGRDSQLDDDHDDAADNNDAKPQQPSLPSIVGDEINGISPSRTKQMLEHWATTTGIPLEKLVTTTYRKVESDVGKVGGAENQRGGGEMVVESIAGKVGGGW